jgi:hypothetical protein
VQEVSARAKPLVANRKIASIIGRKAKEIKQVSETEKLD